MSAGRPLVIKRIAGGMGVEVSGGRLTQGVTRRTLEGALHAAFIEVGLLDSLDDGSGLSAFEQTEMIDALLMESPTQIVDGVECQ